MRKTDELYAKAAERFDARDFDGAKIYAQKCLKIDQKDFRALNLLGVVLTEEGKLDAAKNAYLKSLEANPKNPQTLNNLGNSYAKTGDAESAVKYYKKALDVDGLFLTARYNLAKTLAELKRYDEAINEATKCLTIEPNFLAPYVTIGICLKELKRYDEAKEAYKKALQDSSSVVNALINLGVLAKDEKNFAESEIYLKKAIELEPNNAPAYNNLGITLHAARRYNEALEAFFGSISLSQSDDNTFSNLASLLMDIGEYQKAKGALIKAIELNPQNASAYINFGVLAKWTHEYEESANAFVHATKLDPSNAGAKTNLGILLMLLGDYEQGLALYENREKPSIICDKPLWDGEALDGKTILIYHEQGFGDTINFARLLANEVFKNAKVIFSPQGALQTLFKNSLLPCMTMSHDEIEVQNPHFDYHISLVSLLYVLKIRADAIPQVLKYIENDDAKSAKFASKIPNKKLKIGMVWQGNKEYVGDTKRSIPANVFGLLKDNDIAFVSLQKEYEQNDMDYLKEQFGILDFGEELNDFSDTAALIECLDMVITVDTSVAHLSATIGKPTWILLPSAPDWRWGIGGDKTPWYDSVRLFRAAPNEDWEAVIKRIKANLLQ